MEKYKGKKIKSKIKDISVKSKEKKIDQNCKKKNDIDKVHNIG